MKLTKIIEPETKNYWWVLGQRFKGNELEKYIPTWLSHVSDIYYTEEGGIVNFYISKIFYIIIFKASFNVNKCCLIRKRI